MVGPSNIWGEAGGARTDLGLGRVMSDEAREEGGVLKQSHLYIQGNELPLQDFKQERDLSNLL